MKTFSRRVFEVDEVIFQEGDVANCAYLLKSGKVEISTYRDSELVVLTTIAPNQLFGELALIDNTPRSATAVALEASEAILVRPEDMARHLDGLDEFMTYWIGYLTDRIRDLSKRVDG